MDENKLVSTNFCTILESHVGNIIKDDNLREIKGKDFSIDYFLDKELVSNKMLSIYGENGFFELVVLARKNSWQIFDTGNDQMVDLETLANNGYENFQKYLRKTLKS
ncbi:hypothetical protein BH11BAC2_BH11BAC2_04260 [soil metagenome]